MQPRQRVRGGADPAIPPGRLRPQLCLHPRHTGTPNFNAAAPDVSPTVLSLWPAPKVRRRLPALRDTVSPARRAELSSRTGACRRWSATNGLAAPALGATTRTAGSSKSQNGLRAARWCGSSGSRSKTAGSRRPSGSRSPARNVCPTPFHRSFQHLQPATWPRGIVGDSHYNPTIMRSR